MTRTVRKDNTIIYLSNRYSVPLGTYSKQKEVYIETTAGNRLIVREEQRGTVIADHPISHEKGQLIQDRQHTREANLFFHLINDLYDRSPIFENQSVQN